MVKAELLFGITCPRILLKKSKANPHCTTKLPTLPRSPISLFRSTPDASYRATALHYAPTNRAPKAVFVDRGYRGVEIPNVTIWRSGQKRGVTPSIKKAIHRRSAIEPAIGHMKNDGRLGRNWLKGALGDALHAMLCGAGHNLRMILRAIRLFYGQCFASQLHLLIFVIQRHLNDAQFNQLKSA